jgi:hypothetical protein
MAINPTPFVSGAVLTAAQMTNLPMGLAANTGATATTAFVANTPLTVLSVSATIYANRSYQMFGKLAAQYSTAATVGAALFVNANSIDRTIFYQTEAVGGTNFNLGFSGFTTFTATEMGVTSGSGAVTITLKFKSGGAGSLSTNPDTFVSAGSFSQQLLVMDIGPTS